MGDYLGPAADLYGLDPLGRAGDLGIEQRGPIDGLSLANLDFLSEVNPAVPGQV
jgi:hypothetical protein